MRILHFIIEKQTFFYVHCRHLFNRIFSAEFCPQSVQKQLFSIRQHVSGVLKGTVSRDSEGTFQVWFNRSNPSEKMLRVLIFFNGSLDFILTIKLMRKPFPATLFNGLITTNLTPALYCTNQLHENRGVAGDNLQNHSSILYTVINSTQCTFKKRHSNTIFILFEKTTKEIGHFARICWLTTSVGVISALTASKCKQLM